MKSMRPRATVTKSRTFQTSRRYVRLPHTRPRAMILMRHSRAKMAVKTMSALSRTSRFSDVGLTSGVSSGSKAARKPQLAKITNKMMRSNHVLSMQRMSAKRKGFSRRKNPNERGLYFDRSISAGFSRCLAASRS